MAININDRSYDEKFVDKVSEISGQNFHKCMQCGTCSGCCPMTEFMSMTTRQVMLLAHFGLKGKIMESDTPWFCAACESCGVRCPRGIEIPKVMEAIRQIFLRENVNYIEPFEIPKETIADMPQIALISCFRKHTS